MPSEEVSQVLASPVQTASLPRSREDHACFAILRTTTPPPTSSTLQRATENMRFQPKTPPHLLLPGLAIFLLTLGLTLILQPHTAVALPITHARARAAPHPLVQGVGLLATPRAWHSEANHHSATVVKRICDRFNTACATHDNSTTIATVENGKVTHKHNEPATKVTQGEVGKLALARGLKAHVIADKNKRAKEKVMEGEVEQVMKRGKWGQEEGEVGSREGGQGPKRRKARKSRLGTGFTTMAEGEV